MLQIGSDSASRRDFLEVGSLASGRPDSAAVALTARVDAASQKLPITDKSVVFVFMQGGPSQIETFDPKMTAPAGIRSVNGEIATSLPGVTFGSAFPQAGRAGPRGGDRAFVHDRRCQSRHQADRVQGDRPGPILARSIRAWPERIGRRTGMPTNVAVYPQAVDPSTRAAVQNVRRFRVDRHLGECLFPVRSERRRRIEERSASRTAAGAPRRSTALAGRAGSHSAFDRFRRD